MQLVDCSLSYHSQPEPHLCRCSHSDCLLDKAAEAFDSDQASRTPNTRPDSSSTNWEQRGVLSKEKTRGRRPDQDLREAATHLREIGLVPWEWLADETRALYQ